MDCPLSENDWPIRLSLFKQIVPNWSSVLDENISSVRSHSRETSVSSTFSVFVLFFCSKLEINWKVLYRKLFTLLDDVRIRMNRKLFHGYCCVLIFLQFFFCSRRRRCCWKCAIIMWTVLLNLYLIVSSLLVWMSAEHRPWQPSVHQININISNGINGKNFPLLFIKYKKKKNMYSYIVFADADAMIRFNFSLSFSLSSLQSRHFPNCWLLSWTQLNSTSKI